MILTVNAGSSSLKITLYQVNPLTVVLSRSVSSFSEFTQSIDPGCPITHICHRIVHGGNYTQPAVIINNQSYHYIQAFSDLAPLHNGPALSIIKTCISDFPNAISIAYFDTSFHRFIPPHIANYPIDQSIARQRGLKKYGFHGISYAFILRSVSHFLQKQPSDLNLIALHLGSGASACAIQNGQSLDTSMGLTPLNGLPGATRSGAIDPSLIFHYTNKAGRISHDPNLATNLHVTEAEDILNCKSGWKALTGTTDFRLITERAQLSSPSSDSPDRLAFDLFVDRILNYVGSYYLKLGGAVDALVFAGMIGEKSKELREAVARHVVCLGFVELDQGKNVGVDGVEGTVVDVGVQGDQKQKRLLVCRTDEQFEMASACVSDDAFWKEI